MSDLIYRDVAINALWQEREGRDGFMEECLKRELWEMRAGAKAERNQIENDIYLIRELPSASEWIPMSEEKPKSDGKYLCCWQGKTVDTGFFLNGHFRLYGENKDNLITAWMPLPAPYKEADDE